MRAIVLLALLALAACQSPAARDGDASPDPAAQSTAPANEADAAQGTPITSVGELIGEYRVAGIDGEALEADFGIALSIDGPMMSYEPICRGFVWDIAFDGDRLLTERHREGPPPAPAAPPSPVCAVAVPPVYMQLAQALDAAIRAERTTDNGIRLYGDGRSVTLFTQ